MELIKTYKELEEYLQTLNYKINDYNIAVEALIFNDKGELVLLQRGDNARDERYKLEGVGGKFRKEDNDDLQLRLRTEIKEEIGGLESELMIKIDKLLEVRQVQFYNFKLKKMLDWVVVSHLCRLESGEPFNREPGKHDCIHYLSLDELYEWQEEPTFNKDGKLETPGLSQSLIMGREVYKSKYGNRPYYEFLD